MSSKKAAAETASATPTTIIHARAIEDCATPEHRVGFIVELMNHHWLTRADKRAMAEAWGVTFTTVSRYAAEASRVVKVSPEAILEQRHGMIGVLERISRKAERVGDLKTVVTAIAERAKIVGCYPATRHEVGASVGADGSAVLIIETTPAVRPAGSDGA